MLIAGIGLYTIRELWVPYWCDDIHHPSIWARIEQPINERIHENTIQRCEVRWSNLSFRSSLKNIIDSWTVLSQHRNIEIKIENFGYVGNLKSVKCSKSIELSGRASSLQRVYMFFSPVWVFQFWKPKWIAEKEKREPSRVRTTNWWWRCRMLLLSKWQWN